MEGLYVQDVESLTQISIRVWERCMKIFLLFMGGWLLLCSVQDIKRKEIHISMLFIGIILGLVGAFFILETSIQNRILGLALGVMLLLLNVVTKGQIGIADAIIVSTIGITLGFYITSGILLLAVFLSAIVSLVLMILRRVKRKTTIPFIPFLLAGFVGVLVSI
jgi:leader peptidase (prepilin peptidase) / N-methyltransferase